MINRRQFGRSLLKIMGLFCLLFSLKKNKLFACDPCGSNSVGYPYNGSLENASYMSGNNVLLKPEQNFWGNMYTNAAFAAAADSAAAWGYGQVGITDISDSDGGYLSPHNWHQNGLCFDFRYLGANGQPNQVGWATYNAQANLEFIIELNNQSPLDTVFVGDSLLADELVNQGIPASYDPKGHYDHGHVTFQDPVLKTNTL